MPYEKTFDLLDLAILMQSSREGVCLDNIVQRFGVSRRTAERMRDMILARFPQAVEEKGENNKKYWHIPQGTLRDFIAFSAEDISCLELAKQTMIKSKLKEQSGRLEQIIDKIKASIKPDVYRKIEPDAEELMKAEGLVMRPGPKILVNEEIVAKIRQAILSCHQIKVSYQNTPNRYHILEPYGFLYGDRAHYLLGRHADGYFGDEVHYFILSKISKIEILQETFNFPQNFSVKEFAKRSFGVFQEEPFEVEWLFDKEVADEAEAFEFHPSQKTKRNKNGSLTVCFKAGGKMEMDWHLYTWGDNVKVIKPKNWRK